MFWKIYASSLKSIDPYWRWLTWNGYLIASICWAALAVLAVVKSEDGSLAKPIILGVASIVWLICHIQNRRNHRS